MSADNDPRADLIADAVLRAFSKLPAKRKPQTRNDGTREWIPLAGVVIEDTNTGTMECVALGTGMKALPATKVSTAKGLILHDSHAEVIAIRGFNRYLISQCHPGSTILSYHSIRQPPYSLQPNILIHFYASEAPCGDSSMELIMSRQEDSTPWPEPHNQPHFRGRGYFSHLGIVRTKPGRADSPETLSKSCTDKLSMRCGLSLLLTPTAFLVFPEGIYVSTMVIPESEFFDTAVRRAFGVEGRMSGVSGTDWGGGYVWREMRVTTTKREFEYSRRKTGPKGCNVSAVFVSGVGEETVVGGVLGGRKPDSGWRAGSMLCRAKLWDVVRKTSTGVNSLVSTAGQISYSEVKAAPMLEVRRKVKKDMRAALDGWMPNVIDDFEV